MSSAEAAGQPGSSDDNRPSRPARLRINLLWGLAQVVIVALLFYAGGVLAAFITFDVLPDLFGTRPTSNGVLIGLAAGVMAGLTVTHRSRSWLLRLRVRRLRRDGVTVTATVQRVERFYRYSPKGPGTMTYTVHVRWDDPVSGGDRAGQRRYRFWGRGSRSFEHAFGTGHAIPLLYEAGHPARFVIDMQYAPTMADLFS